MSDTFEVDVREILAQRIAQAPSASAWAEVELRATDPNRPAPPPDRRNRAVVWLAIAAAVVLVVAGAVVLGDDDGSVVIEEGPATTVTEPTDPTTVDEDSDQDDAAIDDNTLDEDNPDVDESGVDEVVEGVVVGSGGFAPIEPGTWHVAATVADASITPGELDEIAAQVERWPGVLDVETAIDAAGWERLTGLASSLCDGVRAGPPCGPGVVLLLIDGQQQPVGRRLESELAMVPLSGASAPVEFIEGYFAAAVDRASPAPLRFDPTRLGDEIALTGPSTDITEDDDCDLPDCELHDEVAVVVDVDGQDVRVGVALTERDSQFALVLTGPGLGFGWGIDELLAGSGGRAAVIGESTLELGAPLFPARQLGHVLARLPLDVAVVTAELSDGTTVWQRPLAGMAVLPDRSGPAESFDSDAVTRVTALDGDGNEILLIDVGPPFETIVTDLRVDSDRLAAAEALLAEEATRPVDAGDLSVTWTEVSWARNEGPSGNFMLWWTVSTSMGDSLSLGDQGVVWRWVDDRRWQPVDALADYDTTWLEEGGDFVIASGRRRVGGDQVTLISNDTLAWREIDRSGLGDEPILATSASGLSIVGEYPGIVAIIDDDRVVEVHDPPWLAPTSGEGRQFFEILDVAGGPVVIRRFVFWGDQDDELGLEAWRYLGDGQWEGPVTIPWSDHVAVLDDLVLMFDRTDFESGDRPSITAGTSPAPLLTTTDGIEWTEHSALVSDTTSGLRIEAGDFFWVYGLHGSSASMQRYGRFVTIWISSDAVDWFPLDVSFADPRAAIKVVGDTIFVFDMFADEADSVWVGHVESS